MINKLQMVYFYILKIILMINEEIISTIQKFPKIFGGFFLCFGVISAMQMCYEGYLMNAIKVLLAFMVIATAIYYISILLYKPIERKINLLLENTRTRHHNINCGIYMLSYKNKIKTIDNIDKILSMKELLETNIILSSLKLRIKMLFDESNRLNYQNILNSGLETGAVLCFSANSNIKNESKIDVSEFVIDTDVFIKEFDEFCKDNPQDIQSQIAFIKNKQKQIKENI